jgi:hypothetical protein
MRRTVMALALCLAIGAAPAVLAQSPSSAPPSAIGGSRPGGSPDCPPGTTVVPGDRAQTAAPGTSGGTMSGSIPGGASGSGTARTTDAPALGSGTQAQPGSPGPGVSPAPGTMSGSASPAIPGGASGSGTARTTDAPSLGSGTQGQPRC